MYSEGVIIQNGKEDEVPIQEITDDIKSSVVFDVHRIKQSGIGIEGKAYLKALKVE